MEKVEKVQINQKTSGPAQAECAMTGQREMLQKISDTLTLITAGREEA